MAVIEHWTDVVSREPEANDPLDRLAIEIALSCRLMPWVDGRPAATDFERLFQRPITGVPETA